jgi:hypothetical protein
MAEGTDYAKVVTFLDTNLFSGSAETFRTAIGAYWDIGSSSTEGQTLQFAEGGAPIYRDAQDQVYGLTFNTYIENAKGNIDTTVKLETSEDVLTPAYRIPIRITGDASKIQNDKEWKAIVLGQDYSDNSYPGLYSAGTFESTPFRVYVPYSKKEAKLFANSSVPAPEQQIEISYNYQNYLEEYENHISTLSTETLIPNLYFFEIFKGQKDNLSDVKTTVTFGTFGVPSTTTTAPKAPTFEVDPIVSEFGSLGILTDEQLSQLYDPEVTSVLPPFQITLDDLTTNTTTTLPNSTEYSDKSWHMRNYLGGTYVQTAVPTGPAAEIPTILKNIFFDEVVFESGGLLENVEDDKSKFPYYIKINFPLDVLTSLGGANPGKFKQAIVDNDFSQKFMKTLKEAFFEETSVAPIESIAMIKGTEYDAIMNNLAKGIRTAETTAVKAIDLLQILTNCYNNYNSKTTDCYFMGETTDARENVMSDDSSRRYENTINSLGVLNYMDTLLQGYLNIGSVETTAMEEILLASEKSTVAVQRNMETIAYRIEKLGGPPLGDNFAQGALQNYWFFNGASWPDNILNFYDSQVKYGIDYTYKVYAYVAVVGQKYEYSDIRMTRQLGTADTTGNGIADQNCLEFYDPNTDLPVSQLYDTEATLDAYRTFLPLGTDAQYVGPDHYLADFYLTWAPTVKIIEIPIYSKTLQVLDNPCSNLDVIPYQVLNDSQKIGFVLNYEFFVQNSFPYTMSPAEAQLKADYQNSNDFIPGEQITQDSVSKARYVEVYRMDTKPKLISDFAPNIHERIDLRLPNTKDVDNIANFVDTIPTNKTFYYLFRVLNEHRVPSHISEIYETTLVNDGGYKYATFNTLFEEDLQEDLFTEPAKAFKKLMHLRPNLSHLTFDTSDVDFGESARSQVGDLGVGSATDLIWGKTFKIRLTSKKTGKKIDLNITYNLENDV